MKKITLDKINIVNILDISIELNKFDIEDYTYKDVYSVLEKNGSRKEISEEEFNKLKEKIK